MKRKMISMMLVFVMIAALFPVSPASAEAAEETAAAVDTLGLSSVWNDRELGGYVMADGRQIREGLLLRTGYLYEITQEDIDILTERYHLKMIVDLRTEGEVGARPDPEIPGAEYRAFNLYGTKDEDGFDNPVYIRYLATQTAKTGYRNLFDALLETEEGAFLWHCKSGKDRTGLASMMILTALGADEDLIMEDFLLTNAAYEMEPEMSGAGEVKEEDMRLALDYLTETYGSVRGYLTDALGLSEEDFMRLQDRYLESANKKSREK